MATKELRPAFDPQLQPIGFALVAELFPGRREELISELFPCQQEELTPGLFDEWPPTPSPGAPTPVAAPAISAQ